MDIGVKIPRSEITILDTLLGRGGSASVYKGSWNNKIVAIKKIETRRDVALEEIRTEVQALIRARNAHVVEVFGYCTESNDVLLVLEYLEHGSLYKRLHVLDWRSRVGVALGVAECLKHLHSLNPPMIHRDIKIANVLLGDGFFPKVSDFGYAIDVPVGDQGYITTNTLLGTPGYCDPEYRATNKISVKSDIFSFGVVLLALITGEKDVDTAFVNGARRYIDKLPIDIEGMVDPKMKNAPRDTVCRVAEVARMCLACTDKRPSADFIVEVLHGVCAESALHSGECSEVAEQAAEEIEDC